MLLTISWISVIAILIMTLFILIYKVRLSKSIKLIAFVMLGLALGYIAYDTLPGIGDDLYRYNIILDDMYLLGKDFFEKYSYFGEISIIEYYFFIFSNPVLKRFLPVVTVFIFYSILFYIFYKENIKLRKDDNNLNKNSILMYIVLIVSCIFFRKIVSCIRYFLAFAILVLAFYRDYVEGKTNITTIILYIISGLLHYCVIPFIIIRVIFNKKFKLLKYKWIVLIMPIIVMFILKSNIFNDVLLLNTMINKFEFYTSNQTVDVKLMFMQIVLWFVLFAWTNNILKQNLRKTEKDYIQFYQIILITMITFLFVPEFFTRYFELICLLSFPILCRIKLNKNNPTNLIFYSTTILIFAYQITDILNNWKFY